MKWWLYIFLFLVLSKVSLGQKQLPDTILLRIQQATDDFTKYTAYFAAYDFYEEKNRDSALFYMERCLVLCKENDMLLAAAACLDRRAYQLTGLGRYAEALPSFFEAFEIAQNPENATRRWVFNSLPTGNETRLLILSLTHHMYAILMSRMENASQSVYHFKEARRLAVEIDNIHRIMLADMNLGRVYLFRNMVDSAIYFMESALKRANIHTDKKYLGNVLTYMGDIYTQTGEHEKAKYWYYQALKASTAANNLISLTRTYYRLANYHLDKGTKDSALYYSLLFRETLEYAGTPSIDINMGTVYENLFRSYLLYGKQDSAIKYARLALNTKDSVSRVSTKSLNDVQNLSFAEQQRILEIEKEKELYRARVGLYALLAGLGIFLLVALILYRNNRLKNKTNRRLEEALLHLKTTQAQLVQSEKMASLGELTAGIAHEIQNPLNFVNNFSELNTELITEMNEALEKGDMSEVTSIAKAIQENEQKIIFHGKRADAIVKGMLQHSRSSSGQKEATDINALADEYLRLAYHGLRAKDKTFNANMRSDLDPNVGLVKVIPQDMGRVILNLITNAFYAVSEKRKMQPVGYEPTVTVSTKKLNGKVEIAVTDNGNGIPANVKDKIFQPFFTTKPTGQGTGLGLSMSYDIITNGHGGELKVETTEGQGTSFIIILSTIK